MHLSPYLKKQCQEVMEKICARPIAQIFFYPVDPIQDNCPNYFDIVKNPMDLGTIKKNLRGNKYKSVSEWKRDMELVWSNSILFNTESSSVGIMALELQSYYLKLTKYISDSYRSSWKNQLIELHQEFALCVKEVNKFKAVSLPKIRQVIKRDQLCPILEELPPPQFRRHYKFFSKDEINKLMNDINSLKVESHIQMIASILKEHEPTVFDDSEQTEIDINTLQPTTLKIIRDQVDQIIHS
ncbi:Bromodomain containing protein [Tritrichomonas foetus]|uniref:Bromodomain containing protein n=1 Tax=Tritrichomonas foetus TaxID=1144522 RepID=A0A1J4L244_9EUKA|nr:Bromodomain containing protein [Tritrichomonas foetus]|eukprot:OHT16014.1 Bromodomain containing protein [Tritrichomonas foetus]